MSANRPAQRLYFRLGPVQRRIAEWAVGGMEQRGEELLAEGEVSPEEAAAFDEVSMDRNVLSLPTVEPVVADFLDRVEDLWPDLVKEEIPVLYQDPDVSDREVRRQLTAARKLARRVREAFGMERS